MGGPRCSVRQSSAALQLWTSSDSPSYLDLDHLSTTTGGIPSQPYSCLVQTLIDPESTPNSSNL